MEEIEEDNIILDEAPIARTGFAAVPVHFRPGKMAEKRIKLVIPSLKGSPEGDLLYLTISGESAEDLNVEIHSKEEIEDETSEPTGKVVEAEDAAVTTEEAEVSDPEVTESMDLDATESSEKIEEEEAAMDNILEELDAPTEVEEVDVLILIGIDPDEGLPEIEFEFKEGETQDEAVARAKSEYPKYRVGSLEEILEDDNVDPLEDKDN
jgi:hypothetical protein